MTETDFSLEDPKYFIAKGTIVVIPALGIHYDPEIYPDPEKFEPERFTDKEIAARSSCTWLPFGEGPRNCIGLRFGLMQTCVGLAYLIRGYKFNANTYEDCREKHSYISRKRDPSESGEASTLSLKDSVVYI